jgi:hypothetical protein
VRGPVLRPPCRRHRPFGIVAAWHGPSFVRAPQITLEIPFRFPVTQHKIQKTDVKYRGATISRIFMVILGNAHSKFNKKAQAIDMITLFLPRSSSILSVIDGQVAQDETRYSTGKEAKSSETAE